MAHLPGRGHRHSTWTRRRRQSHTKIYFDQARVHVAYQESLCEGVRIGQNPRRMGYGQRMGPTPLGRDRRTHNPPTSSTEMAMLICDSDTYTETVDHKTLFSRCTVIDVPMVGPSTKSSARSIRLRCLSGSHYYFLQGKMASTPTLSLCGFRQAGLPIARNLEQIDNGVQSREVLAGLGLDDEGEEEDEDREDEDEDGEEGDEEDGDGERQVKGSRWRVSRSQLFAHYLPNATSTSQSRIAPNVPSWSL
ncbi:BZ3500_MvSof-1268-A1-R1_Chr4-2g06881 [Microbotryum saponariae]|uniref:BZ3500_MvSof-1268-A1-R1_Chr4-2g06881 protein n=1 Tax=Microbotryum saponariae TaxID=289078 RepID=A0A2X0NKI4_9BASI|nr:BZ3500_MvSof-1268-A1-R1_Chr4-2g06881 [Microbotryum saponariae]SDA06546.1 BZ3501_MvSof-1269-A2-R1_Chr4-2g06592 [Microbotryum saponariae]